MNEKDEQNKLGIIFNHFKILMKYTKNNQDCFYLSDNLVEFNNQFDEYSNLLITQGKHNLCTLKEFYHKFKIYSPSTGKCKLILKSVDKIFQLIQHQKSSQLDISKLNDTNSNAVILDILKADCKEQISLIKSKISECQQKNFVLKAQKNALEQEFIKKIQDVSDCIKQISDICKLMDPEILKKSDDHNIKRITDLIYIIDKNQ